ncbi:hypothetical protein CFC21_052300 [Triticum aestivum]|uniref:Uncharacterized protein n=4 Tax=Triticum TaxID=4564 RepID=A0A9R0VY18_TRITD|nr:hypothetical protein TRIUR3_21445 [Triticum urartu]KAF7042802.1 hypothetical protein CFC21_052300 [Triticum aestivum]VAH91493.1 unnamed protein product [Triticum turgidum subsp. durum]
MPPNTVCSPSQPSDNSRHTLQGGHQQESEVLLLCTVMDKQRRFWIIWSKSFWRKKILINQFGKNNAKIKFSKGAEQPFTVSTLTNTMVGSCLPSPDRDELWMSVVPLIDWFDFSGLLCNCEAPVSVDLNVRPGDEVMEMNLAF